MDRVFLSVSCSLSGSFLCPLEAKDFFAVTLGSRKLTEQQGRTLKLISGLMMLALAIVLLVDPSILQNASASALLLLAVLAVAAITLRIKKMFQGLENDTHK